MAKVRRRVVADGDWYLVECALRADGQTSPVSIFIDELASAAWPSEGDGVSDADAQVSTRSWFLAVCEAFAETGEMPRRDYNMLRDGFWEFKHLDFRVSFYDTDGYGNYQPKLQERHPLAGGGYFPLPDFDEIVRLGHPFFKETPRTPESELRTAAAIREEDLSHD